MWTLNGCRLTALITNRDTHASADHNQNFRWKSQLKKHNLRVNIVYVDGHSALQRPSRIYWGQFYARSDGMVRPNLAWNSPVSNAALDAAQIPPDQ